MRLERLLQAAHGVDQELVHFGPVLLRVAVTLLSRDVGDSTGTLSLEALPNELFPKGLLDLAFVLQEAGEVLVILIARARASIEVEFDSTVTLTDHVGEREPSHAGSGADPRLPTGRNARVQPTLCPREREQAGPEPLPGDLPLRHLLLRIANSTSFLARARDEREQWSRHRLSDRDRLDLHEIEVGRGRLVEPADRFDVLGPGVSHDPDRSFGFKRGKVGEDFAQVIVIRLLELILDDDRIPRFVLADEVATEAAGRLLSLRIGELEVERIVENVNVLLELRREVVGLVRPDVAESLSLDLSDHVVISHRVGAALSDGT